jgi:hypothetical protein
MLNITSLTNKIRTYHGLVKKIEAEDQVKISRDGEVSAMRFLFSDCFVSINRDFCGQAYLNHNKLTPRTEFVFLMTEKDLKKLLTERKVTLIQSVTVYSLSILSLSDIHALPITTELGKKKL